MPSISRKRSRPCWGHVGTQCWIEAPFHCDYGTQITIGDHFFANYDCIFLDVAPIVIGNHVFLGPRVSLYTAGHPLTAQIRNLELEFGKPITIGDSVWIGGDTTVLPGVTIGPETVVAAGSVVTKDLPGGVIAAGNPCRVLRPLSEEDRAFWLAQLEAYRKAAPEKNKKGRGPHLFHFVGPPQLSACGG